MQQLVWIVVIAAVALAIGWLLGRRHLSRQIDTARAMEALPQRYQQEVEQQVPTSPAAPSVVYDPASRRMVRRTVVSILCAVLAATAAQATTTVFNPFTGKPDYVSSVSAGVTTFAGRSGAVSPQSGDYNAWYALIAHLHTITDVTGLQAALDGKSSITHVHPILTYNPTALTVVTGTLISGTYASLADYGSNTVDVQEATGTSALEATVSVSGMTGLTFNNLLISGRYQGGAGHEVAVEIYNAVTTAWETLGYMTTSSANAWYSYPLFNNGAAYINGSGMVQVRFRHVQPGINTHHLYLDYLVLRSASDANSGGLTAHEALTGRGLADQHPIAAVTDLQAAIDVTVRSSFTRNIINAGPGYTYPTCQAAYIAGALQLNDLCIEEY